MGTPLPDPFFLHGELGLDISPHAKYSFSPFYLNHSVSVHGTILMRCFDVSLILKMPFQILKDF